MNTLAYAQRYHAAGRTVIPIADDGSKSPVIKWKQYETERPTVTDVTEWFSRHDGMAMLCGAASGNIEVIDFDNPTIIRPWAEEVRTTLPTILDTLPLAQTPSGGYHVFYHCAEVGRNSKLAQHPLDDGRPEVDIETRGEGGYVIVYPTPARYHPDNKPWRMLRGNLWDIPEITPDERSVLLAAARSLNTYKDTLPPVAPTLRRAVERNRHDKPRPGDVFNEQTTWAEILEPEGWRMIRRSNTGDNEYWQRPGKKGIGISASITPDGNLYVFSSNASPFEPERSYSKFMAYTMLKWRNDMTAATKYLAARYHAELTQAV